MSKNSDNLVIIIPVYNQVEYTRGVLDSIYRSNITQYTNIQIVVVDNNSDKVARDFLADWLTSDWGSKFTLTALFSDENLGYAGGVNHGLAHISTTTKWLDYDVLILNNDMELHVDCIDELKQCMIQEDNIGIVGGLLFFPSGRVQHGGACLGANGWGVHLHTDIVDEQQLGSLEIQEMEYVTGALFLIKSDLRSKLPNFDPIFIPQYFEEVDYCYSARKLGYKTVFTPKAKAIHYENVTGKSLVGDRGSIQSTYSDVNQLKFYKKWMNLDYEFTSEDRIMLTGKFHGNWSFTSVLKRLAKGLHRNNVDVAIASEEYHNREHVQDWEIKQLMDKPSDYWNRYVLRSSEGDHMYLMPPSKKRIAHTTGESSVVHRGWVDQLRNVDQVLTTSNFFKQVLIDSGVTTVPIDVLPNSIDNSFLKKEGNVAPVPNLRRLNFYSNFFFGLRKNPVDLIDGFVEAFTSKDDVTLTVHALGIADILRHQEGKDIQQWANEIIQDRDHAPILINPHFIPNHLQPAYLRNFNVHVTTTFSEGFGLPVVELAGLGIPTITTGYSGVLDFVDNNTGWLVDYKLEDIPIIKVPYFKNFIGGRWARIDKADFIRVLRDVYNNPQGVTIKGTNANLKAQSYSIDLVGLQAKRLIFQ